MKIDFVVLWVDGSDKKWQEEKMNFTGIPAKENDVRYRDWGLMRYWFRAVEKNAPWVNKIYFVTWGHIPEWLNTTNSKLKVVNHRDFIPEEYLPTFNSNSIELNIHRISDLSEHFVYFNDDMLVNNYVGPEDFFENGLPKASAVMSVFTPTIINDQFQHCLCNDIAFMNTHFHKKDVIRRNLKKWYNPVYGKYILKNIYNYFQRGSFSMIQNFHMASSMLKSTYNKVWELEPELLHNTSKNKLRTHFDVNQYIMTYYDIGTGRFSPRTPEFGRYYELKNNNTALLNDISEGKHKMICINDSASIEDIEHIQKELIDAFEKRYPDKSSFEI